MYAIIQYIYICYNMQMTVKICFKKKLFFIDMTSNNEKKYFQILHYFKKKRVY